MHPFFTAITFYCRPIFIAFGNTRRGPKKRATLFWGYSFRVTWRILTLVVPMESGGITAHLLLNWSVTS